VFSKKQAKSQAKHILWVAFVPFGGSLSSCKSPGPRWHKLRNKAASCKTCKCNQNVIKSQLWCKIWGIINEWTIYQTKEFQELFLTHPYTTSIASRILRTKTSKWCQRTSYNSCPCRDLVNDSWGRSERDIKKIVKRKRWSRHHNLL